MFRTVLVADTRVAGPVLLACVLVLAGCSGTLLEFTASPAEVPDAALDAHGYVHGNTTEVPLTYRVSVSGASRNVTAQTWVSGYRKTVPANGTVSGTTADGAATDATPPNATAVFVLYSSPDVEVANRSINPLSQLSNRELVRAVLDRSGDVSRLGGVENLTALREDSVRNVTMLGTGTRMVRYAGTADIEGQRVAVLVTVAAVEHEGDVVVALGIHDDRLDETLAQVALVESVRHGRDGATSVDS